MADQSTAVSVVSPAGLELDNTTVSAQLYYRVGSTGSFQSLSMQAIDGGIFHGVFGQSAGVMPCVQQFQFLVELSQSLYTSVRDIEKEIPIKVIRRR